MPTEQYIRDQIDHWLNDGFDVPAILNSVLLIRQGEAEVSARNAEWEENSKFVFGVKTPEEVLDPDHWKEHCINIVRKDFWEENRHIEDRYLREITLPKGFGQCGRGLYDYDPSVPREEVIRKLQAVGFWHSLDLQQWMMRHDP